MKWSIKLGRFLGIDVFLHITFLLFLAYIGWAAWATTGSTVGVLHTVGFFVAVFTCVVLHEYGHALTARRYGIGTEDITLLPIGGVARLERMPSNPVQELWVALAGPAVNVAIAAIIVIWQLAQGFRLHVGDLLHFHLSGDFLSNLLRFNLVMIAFNLLPAFPMDGGRVLRALLAMRMPYAKATRVAATIGQGMAVLFAFWVFAGGPQMLLFIALFVWLGASAEAGDAEERSLLSGLRARDGMLTEYHQLRPEDTARTVSDLILRGWQADFPVLMDGRVVGVVTRQDVVGIYQNGDPAAPVATFMRDAGSPCDAGEPLFAALERLRASGLPLLTVMEGDRLIGLLTPENVLEAVMFRQALAGRSASEVVPPVLAG